MGYRGVWRGFWLVHCDELPHGCRVGNGLHAGLRAAVLRTRSRQREDQPGGQFHLRTGFRDEGNYRGGGHRRRLRPSPLRLPTNRDDPNYYRLPGDGSHVMGTDDDGEGRHSSTRRISSSASFGYDFGPLRLYDAMRKFGFGQLTGIDFQASSTASCRTPARDDGTRPRSRVPQSDSSSP